MVTRTHKRALHRHALPKHALPKHALHRRTRKQRGGAKLDEYSILQFNDVEQWPSKVYVYMTKTKHGYLPFESNCIKTFFDRSLSKCDGYFLKSAINYTDVNHLNDVSVLIEYKLYKYSNIAPPPVVELLNNPTFFDINFGMPSNTTYTNDILSKAERNSGFIHFNEKNDEHKYIYKHFTFYKKKPKLEIVSPPSTEQPKEKYTVFTDFDNTLTENMTTFKLEHFDTKTKKKIYPKIAVDDVDADNNWAEIDKTFKEIKEDKNTDIVVVTSSFQRDINATLNTENNDEAQKYKNVFTTISNNNSYPYDDEFKFSDTDGDKAVVIGIPAVEREQILQNTIRSQIKFEQIDNYLRNTDNGALKKRSLFIDDDIDNCNLIHEKFSEMLVIWAKNIIEDRPKKGNYLKNLKAMKLAIEYIKDNEKKIIIKTDTSVKDENDDKNVKKLWTSERIIKFIEEKNNEVEVETGGVVEDAVDTVEDAGVSVVVDNNDAVNTVEENNVLVVPVVEVDKLITNMVKTTNNSTNAVIEEEKPDLDKLFERIGIFKLNETTNKEIIKALNDLNIIIKTVDKPDVTSGTTRNIKQKFELHGKILAANRKLDDILYKKNPQNTQKRDVGGKRISKRKTRKVKKQGKIKAIINKQRLNKRLSHKRLWRSRHMRSRLLRRRLTRKTK